MPFKIANVYEDQLSDLEDYSNGLDDDEECFTLYSKDKYDELEKLLVNLIKLLSTDDVMYYCIMDQEVELAK